MTSGNQTILPRESILVDGHVHIHDCFNLQSLFDSARQNFCRAAHKLGIESHFNAVLLLAESHNVNHFSSLRQKAKDKKLINGWRFQATLESESLKAISPASFDLTIVANR